MTSSKLVRSLLLLLALFATGQARPVVRNIRSAHEFDRLIEKHGHETGLPVVVDFYSDSCGPCRMMAPIFKKVAEEFKDKAVFCKVDTNAQYELSGRFQVRSLPTFMFFVAGKKAHQAVGGIGEQGLRQETTNIVRQAEYENVVLTMDSLRAYYEQVAPDSVGNVESIYKKCADKNKANAGCVGSTATQLARKLQKKYKKGPKLGTRFSADAAKDDQQSSSSSSSSGNTDAKKKASEKSSKTKQQAASLQTASVEELLEELERRRDAEREAMVEEEAPDEDEANPDFAPWVKSSFPERLVIIGGGPAGLAAALYGARSGLRPLVLAPSMGGQLLQGKGGGVDVENYPGLLNQTGPALINAMRQQAAHYGAYFEDDIVNSVDASQRPFKVYTNATGMIETHTIIVATGADARWLRCKGEWELRNGGGVSSCATCDGFLYANMDVIVVGGGDAAMEDALVLARTSKSVRVVHRRDRFRASKVLSDRVLQHPKISVIWNSTVEEIVGKPADSADEKNEGDSVDLDNENQQMITSGVILKDVATGETRRIDCDGVFIAIGHNPNTGFLNGVVQYNMDHAGYVQTYRGTTVTSVDGIFAAGDVADPVYRQAVTSAGSGAAAALDAERYLSEHGLGMEEEDLEAELLAELLKDNPSAYRQDDNDDLVYNAYEEAGGKMTGMKESFVGSEL